MAVAVRALDNTGIAFGAATPLAAGLTQPLIVCVTEYEPAVVTVIDAVVAPLLHNNAPVVPVAVNTELPQLLVTFTTGVAGIAFTVKTAAFEFTEPLLLVQTARNCLLLSPIAVANDSVLLVAPEIFVQVPLVFTCHCTVGAGLPVAAEVKLAFAPAHLVCDEGCVVTTTACEPLPVENTTSTK